jgi:hypothetical protein
MSGMCATQFNLLGVVVTNIQTFSDYNSNADLLCSIGDGPCCNAEVWIRYVTTWEDDPPKVDVEEFCHVHLIKTVLL